MKYILSQATRTKQGGRIINTTAKDMFLKKHKYISIGYLIPYQRKFATKFFSIKIWM